MLDIYRKVIAVLTPSEKRRGFLIMLMVILMAMLETVGVASILPFLSVIGNPDIVFENPYLHYAYQTFGFESTDTFLLALGMAAFLLVVVSSLFKVVTTYAINRYTQMRRHTLGERLLETYLRQPYTFFLRRHSGDLAKGILSEVDLLVANVIKPGFDALSYGVVAIALALFLVIFDPVLAFYVGLVIGGTYTLIYMLIKKKLTVIGRIRADANSKRFTAAGEALAGIKDIKLLGREHAYLARFTPASILNSRHQATNQTLSVVPKYVIEAIGLGGVIILALVLMSRSDDFSAVVPVLGLYAFAGYKLLPAAQNIYASLTKLKFGSATIDDIYNDLYERDSLSQISAVRQQRMEVNADLSLEHVSFQYPGEQSYALQDVHLKIPKGTKVGLIGGTGAGKTTLVDLILGLLTPSKGHLAVDGVTINDENVRNWQGALGYVPQEIFLIDASISENIAFGVPEDEIDQEKVEYCARMAQLDAFVNEQLDEGYATSVGDKGVRLSGGQRQRIGIARALYHEPDVLVLDEATSALDNITERAVMQAVNEISKEKTIIIIAHRLSTVETCDQIFILDTGKVVDSGTYKELLENSAFFQKMVV